ncbi:MAG: stage V sporulation protein AD [Bacilli bacterium]|nr:stage V sporulation protein AD [Bacilli bacterium]
MTFKYKNVYINETALVTGPYEKKGPLESYFDKSYSDLYFGGNTWEGAESKLIEESVNILLSKLNKTKFDIDVHVSGDLLNQLVSSNYASSRLGIPYLGVYNACATSVEGLIVGANMVEAKQVKNCVVSVSSHNNAAEKQFRYPVEYGGPKPKTTTFTTTGGASCYLSYNKTGIKIESSTIGKVVDMGIKDAYHMGAVMAPAACETLYEHLKETKRKVDYYDLILTGDLGVYGKEIFKEYLKDEYNIEIKNYDDTGTMIYDLNKQPVYAGGSGPACAPLVTFGYIFNQMKKNKLNKVLLIATGALLSTTMVNEKYSIPAIAHAISLEVIE